MQVRIEDVSPVEKKLFVEVPWQTVAERLNVAYRELGKGVALRGFRKGKAPRSVLEQIYAPRIHADVAEQLIRESFVSANREHQLGAVAEPRDLEGAQIKRGEPFAYAAIVEVKGAVTAADYEGMPLERRRLAVPEAEVDKALEQLQKEHTELVPIEGRDVTAAGDVVIASITGTIGEHPVNQPRFGVDLDDAEREPLPGLRALLIGLPFATADHPLEIDIPADHADDNLKGRKASLRATIVEVRAKNVPNLDDDFAKDTGKADSIDGLRAAIRADLEARERSVITNETRQGALRELVKRNQIPVATSLVERAVFAQYNRLRQMLGMPPDREGQGLTPDLMTKMSSGGADEVRGQLLLEAIADKEGISVSDEELNLQVAMAAKAKNQSPQKVRAEWAKDGRLDNARWSLRQDKTLDFLVSKAAITEVDTLTQPASADPGPVAPVAAEVGHVHGPDCDH
ncbi:MAG: trigger factor [Kofleriaceae bacterium]|nr:trigger factor [Kofleriaceae bacterium]MBP9172787.1 trigger factor [Kofleriaceae bacterium]MBP9863167.1 trigger factor [Kofleriaceae bacterium]